MAMTDKVQFSGENRNLEQIAFHHLDAEAGLRMFFASDSPELHQRYAGDKLEDVRYRALAELDFTSSLAVLSSTEASIRIDYRKRCERRRKDPISSLMREIYASSQDAARLEDLLHAWRNTGAVPKPVIGELIGAFKYRNWLAHGRYWVPKLGRKYDYFAVYAIAQRFLNAMDSYQQAYKPIS